MADKAKAGGSRPQKELHPLVIVDQINKELLRQRNYGLEWGALVPDYPKTEAERLAQRKAELAELSAKAAQIGAPASATAASYTSTTNASFPPRTTLGSLETGLGGAYRKLKAGV